jgi:small subunit ribosomal protein S6
LKSKKYEGLFLVDPEVASKKWDELSAHITGTIKKHEGEIIDLNKWQELRLAYEIKKRRKGTYLLGHFMIPPEKVNTIRDEFKISELVLRHLFIVDTGRMQCLPSEEGAEGEEGFARRRERREAAPETPPSIDEVAIEPEEEDVEGEPEKEK